MMKLSSAVAPAGAALLLLPALQGGGGSLADGARELGRAIEVLRGVEERLEVGDRDAVALARRAAEPAAGEARERDGKLETLRHEVALLQTELDVLEARASESGAPVLPEPPPIDAGPRRAPEDDLAPITTGLDDETREALGWTALPPPRERADEAAGAPEPRLSAEPGYSADPVLHGIACWRAGRYAEGATLLARAEGDPGADRWRALCLRDLGRLEEAVELLRGAVLRMEDGAARERARDELAFLEWRLALRDRMPEAVRAEEAPRKGKSR